MTTFFNRPIAEQELIRKVYQFEAESIRNDSSAPNPYIAELKALPDGSELLEAIEEALEMEFH